MNYYHDPRYTMVMCQICTRAGHRPTQLTPARLKYSRRFDEKFGLPMCWDCQQSYKEQENIDDPRLIEEYNMDAGARI